MIDKEKAIARRHKYYINHREEIMKYNNSHKQQRSIYMKKYYQEHKEAMKNQSKEYRKTHFYKYIAKNLTPEQKERKKIYSKLYMKRTNYAWEKTPRQRMLRNIKRMTRYYFPLEDKYCEQCFKPAEEHHHDSNPIQFDKFVYTCHSCHKMQHQINNAGGINKQ